MTSTRQSETTRKEPSLSTEEQLALAIEALSEHVVLFDAEDRVVLANKAWRELNNEVIEFTKPGTRFEDHLRALIEKELVPESSGREEEWLRERMELHLNPSGPFEVARQDGRWIRVYEQRLPNNGTILIISDITKSKQMDQALRESEAQFRAVVNNSPTKIHIKDLDGRYLLVNPEAQKLFGVTEEEARGKTTHEIFPEKQADYFGAHDQAVLETGQTIEQEEQWELDDGVHTYLMVKFPIRDDDDETVAIGAIGTDITERKRAEELSQRLGRILDSSFNEIYVFDAQTYRFSQVNQGALNNLGYTMQELSHMTPWDIKPEFDEESFRTAVEPLFRGEKEMLVLDTEHQRKNGSSYPVEVRLQLSGSETPPVFVAIIADITERKSAEEAVNAARVEANTANRAKSEFLATMSHELRTPLNAIIGFSEIIKDETFGPVGSVQYRSYAEDINESGQHLLDLVNDILDLSKVESGTDELHEENIDIPEIISSVLNLVKGRAHKGNIELEIDVPEDGLVLRADQRKLKQILINLLSNAIKFTLAGGKVTLRAWSRAESGYVFQVIDTGIGIAFKDIPKALAPFQQIDSELNRKFEGTGLGLPLTKSLVEMHGGYLDFQSEVGVGTTVTVRFPAERIVCSSHDIKSIDTATKKAG